MGGQALVFFCTDTNAVDGQRYRIGYPDKGAFVLNRDRIRQYRAAAVRIPKYCQDCFNLYHCARGCPDLCFLDDEFLRPESSRPDQILDIALFRCRVQKRLALYQILEAAEEIVRNESQAIDISSTTHQSQDAAIASHINNLPSNLDKDAILAQYNAHRSRYAVEERQMPAPIWAQRSYEHTGPEAWSRLKQSISGRSPNQPISIYVHIPFCKQQCLFCDCYAFPLGNNASAKDERYVRSLQSEIKAFSQISPLERRPVTTVHFGGGTPNCIRPGLLESIVEALRDGFNISNETEWAIESTGMLIDKDQLNLLKQLDFRRLHVGVQTLSDPLRQKIGRKANSKTVIRHLNSAMKAGFVTSVDIIFGLPDQTMESLLETLEILSDEQIHGISLYRLNLSKKNRLLFKRFGDFRRDPVHDYTLYSTADRFLISCGYRKNHFVHFAKEPDRNLYYTHAKRGEDLLALGATADGLFGHYHYRHPGLAKYMKGDNLFEPILEGGMHESALERKLRPAISDLMCSDINIATIQEIQAEKLLEDWLKYALIKPGKEGQNYFLTESGSWFINSMIAELKGVVYSDSALYL